MPPKSTTDLFIISGEPRRFSLQCWKMFSLCCGEPDVWKALFFCSWGLCFLTSGSGIFRCWLWIISCNDGSAWRVCLDSMPASWNTDQIELSCRLHIEAGIHEKERSHSVAPSSYIKLSHFRSGSKDSPLSPSYHQLGGQVKGERSQMAACILSSGALWSWLPIAAIKAVTPLTRAAKIQYSITDLSRFPFCHREMSLRSGSLLF